MPKMKRLEWFGVFLFLISILGCAIWPDMTKYTGLLSAAFVLLGWLIVFRNAQYTASRSETKGFIDDLMKSISDIESSAVNFWLASRKERQEPKTFSVLINGKFKIVDEKIDLIKKRKVDIGHKELVDLLGCLQEKVTLDCESADAIDSIVRVQRANEVMAEAVKVHTHLYTKFIDSYPVNV